MSSLDFKQVSNATSTNAAAFRCRRTLQPGGGPGTKVFPPTYAGAVYAIEQRRLPGREQAVTCVLLDSVQSQANRMEEALQQAIVEGKLKLPLIEVDFSDADLIEPVGKISSLQAPHRIADAILRDSELSGTKFRESEIGKTINSAGPLNATPLYKLCPTALVFGMWDSTGPKGGLGIKIERAMVSEIVGIGIERAEKNRGVRWDPLGASKSVLIKGTPDNWRVVEGKDAKGAIRPSEINHGSVPFDSDNAGVTLESAEQTITLSLIALRRLRFPANGKLSSEIDIVARAVLAALGLCAATLSAEKGLDLRSRCLLWPDGPMQWELLAKPGEAPQAFTLDSDGAIKLLADAVAHAAKAGLKWEEKPITLKPSKSLVDLVRKSQEQAAKGVAEDGEVEEKKEK
jgi:CRISPR-associated protein Csb1